MAGFLNVLLEFLLGSDIANYEKKKKRSYNFLTVGTKSCTIEGSFYFSSFLLLGFLRLFCFFNGVFLPEVFNFKENINSFLQ